MVQLKWHDGSTKNVHVDPVLLFDYQHQLEVVMQMYRRRVEWLSQGSRKTFGTVVEQRYGEDREVGSGQKVLVEI